MLYQHILFATDFSEDAMQVGERAKDIARLCGARLGMIHVIEDINISLGGGYELLPVLPGHPQLPTVTSGSHRLSLLPRTHPNS